MFKSLTLVILVISVMLSLAFTKATPLESARGLFPKLDQGKNYVDSLINISSKHTSNPVMLAYHGAAQTARASYLYNPYSQYTTAKKGLETMNKSVSKASSNLEVRFVRYSVELNIPAIMPFTDHTKEDKKFILTNLDKNHDFYPAIKTFMLKFGNLTDTEKKKFN